MGARLPHRRRTGGICTRPLCRPGTQQDSGQCHGRAGSVCRGYTCNRLLGGKNTTAYIEDGGKIGNATITTSSSVAGGWAGAWGGAVLVGKGGVAIGGIIGGPVGAAIGGFAGSVVGGIAGAFGGSWLGEKAAGEVLNSNKK